MPSSISLAAASAALNSSMSSLGVVIQKKEDILEYPSYATLPAVGVVKKVYIAVDTNRTYRWTGSAYVEVSPPRASTDTLPEGAVNLYFTAARAQAAVTAITGNAATATKLQTARAIAVSGDITGTANFDGSSAIAIAATLANSGVVAGNYGDSITIPDITVNSKGLVTGVTGVAIRQASTAQTGVVQLNSSTVSASTTEAATPLAVKTAYDLALAASVTANAAIPNGQKGVANGVATLDANGFVPVSMMPSYVDDVLEYPTKANFPATGATGKIYVAVDTLAIYRWGGTVYVEISASPGTTDDVVEGTTNLYFTAARAQAAVTTITGNAGTATKLQTARTVAVSGDVTGSASFDGSANITIAASLPGLGPAGMYPMISFDTKGRVVGGRDLLASDMPATVAETDQNNTWTKGQRGAVLPVSAVAGVLTLDLNTSNNFETTLAANATLALPSNINPGQSGVLKVTQDAVGGRTMAYNSVFKFAGGTAIALSTAPNAVDNLCYYVESATRITLSALKDTK